MNEYPSPPDDWRQEHLWRCCCCCASTTVLLLLLIIKITNN